MPISKLTTGSISDSVAIDTDTLVVDGTNNRVGINTTTPNEALTIEAPLSGDTGLAINYSGDNKAGITVNPSTGQIQVGVHPDLASANAYYLSFNTAASNTVYERMRIDSSGRVTMPAQPRFSAYYAGNNNNTNNIASGGGEIPLNATRFNNGGHFSTSTSRFTAPIAGVYQFNTCFFGYINSGQVGAGNSIYLVLRVNGSNTVYITYQFYASTSSYPPLTGSVLVYLNASDYVTLYSNTGVYTDASNLYTHFSGYLIG